MSTAVTHNASKASLDRHRIARWGVIAGALLGLAAAIALPFYFQSASILYKFGWERLMLLSAQAMGVVAGYLMILQLIASARIKIMDRLFGLETLFTYHRYGGCAIACLILLHPVLIFISDDRLFIPFQVRYWPEFVGLLVWALLAATAAVSLWRERMGIAFHRWLFFHRSAAVTMFVAFWIHLYFVNEKFRQGAPLGIFWGALGFGALALIWSRTRFLRARRSPFSVTAVEPAGKGATQLKIEPASGKSIEYLPGQFGFITPLSSALRREEHPFTIASTPTRPEGLEFIIRAGGDWTEQLARLRPGDKVLLDGPFGKFSYLLHPAAEEIVFIAGGIGITPMLSMLRHMADRNDQRKITLIWSNRSEAHVVLEHEFQRLASSLSGLAIHQIFTRPSGSAGSGRANRLDRSKIEKLLSGCSRRSLVFVCGPDRMIADVSRHLLSIGFRKHAVFSERFIL